MAAKSHAAGSDPVPAWVRKLALPLWVCASDRRIRFINARAEALLSSSASACLGQPCHLVVAGQDQSGKAHCAPECPILHRVRFGLEIEPLLLEVARPPRQRHWIQLLVIPVRTSGHELPSLVHCALPFEREHRLEEYMSHLAARSASHSPRRAEHLTNRERQILDLLSADHSLRAIALELHVSYVTVRNHVQHLLAKLDAHSIQEAVALRLMEGISGAATGEPSAKVRRGFSTTPG